ncbi:MAG: hypothetical protein JW801_14120 [Bacteroidales bacterium]|nr:hypothetical protein [Bacteroidales bacterium]
MTAKPVHCIILDLKFSGYGIIRSLHPYKIPTIGFYNDRFIPEARTRLCERKYFYRNEEELLEKLLGLDILKDEKPVLFLTTDYYANFYAKHQELLQQKFLMNFPDRDKLEIMMDKHRFYEFAAKHNILVPKTLNIDDQTPESYVESNIRFPAILKPFLRQAAWKQHNLPKAFFLSNMDDYRQAFRKSIVADTHLLIQEWIPGKDFNVYYCLTYYDADSKPLAAFNGIKLRQWPVGTGSTASGAIAGDDWIEHETKRIFSLLNYRGLGSIEYKKSDSDGKYYLIEPTAGRTNQQEIITTMNGINIPLIAYNSLTDSDIKAIPPKKLPVIYVDELAEISSTLVHFARRLHTFREWRRSLKGKKEYRYWYKKDPGVFLSIPVFLIQKIFSYFRRHK